MPSTDIARKVSEISGTEAFSTSNKKNIPCTLHIRHATSQQTSGTHVFKLAHLQDVLVSTLSLFEPLGAKGVPQSQLPVQ
jgi:hypothetical protein